MRKFLAVLLSVLMIASVLATLPAAASEKYYDNSIEADSPKLIVTEIMVDSVAEPKDNKNQEVANAFDYIELYNAGTQPIHLRELALVYTSYDYWLADGCSFVNGIKVEIEPYFTVAGGNGNNYTVTNPSNDDLDPGEFAVLWIWNTSTVTASNYNNFLSLGEPDLTTDGTALVRHTSHGNNPNNPLDVVYFPKFRDFYTAQEGKEDRELDEVTVFAVNGTVSKKADGTASTAFDMTYSTRMYGIVNKYQYNDMATPVYDGDGPKEGVLCLFKWGSGTMMKGGPSAGTEAYPGLSVIYVPAKCEPSVWNAQQKQTDANYNEEANFNYIEVGIADGSYREAALFLYGESPTVGEMEPYQWLYVDPENAPDAVKTCYYDAAADLNKDGVLQYGEAENPNWKDDALAALLVGQVPDLSDEERDEENQEVKNVTQDDLLKKTNSNRVPIMKTVLTTWGLILIIVGAVIGVGGIALLVVLLLKKKKGAAPAEEAPADEEPKE